MLPGLSAKWHGIEKGRALRPDELKHIAAVIERWLRMQTVGIPEEPARAGFYEPPSWIHAAAGSTAVSTPLKFSGSDLWIWVAAMAA
jgi:hypothetical protein